MVDDIIVCRSRNEVRLDRVELVKKIKIFQILQNFCLFQVNQSKKW